MMYYVLGVLTIIYVFGAAAFAFLGALGQVGFFRTAGLAIAWPIVVPPMYIKGWWSNRRWRRQQRRRCR